MVVTARDQLAGASNIRSQQDDSLIQSRSKKLKLDSAIISTKVDEDEGAVGAGDGLKCGSGMPDVYGTTISDAGLQHESSVEDDNATIRFVPVLFATFSVWKCTSGLYYGIFCQL